MTEYFSVKPFYRVMQTKPRPPKRITPRIYLNEKVHLDISSKERALHFGVLGKSGSGKTIAAGVIANQFNDAIFIDPKGGSIGFRKAQLFLGETQNWRFLSFSDSFRTKNALKINVRDCGVTSCRALFFHAVSSREKEIRVPLFRFFSKKSSDVTKNFFALKQLFSEFPKAEQLWEEISVLFDENDNGFSIEQLQRGRWCIDVSRFDPRNRSLGMFLGSLIDFRMEKPFLAKNWLLVACDEADTFAKATYSSGVAMGYLFAFGRGHLIAGMIIGTGQGEINVEVKRNLSINLLFSNPQEREKLEKMYGIFLDLENYTRLTEIYGEFGNCFLYSQEFGYVEALPIHVNFFYRRVRELGRRRSEDYGFVGGSADAMVNDRLFSYSSRYGVF